MKINKLILIIVIVFFLIFSYLYIRDRKIKNDIKSKYEKTVGYFSEYIDGVDGGEPIIKYYYFVNKEKIFNAAFSDNKYKYCTFQVVECSNKRFWVIYSPTNPTKSLIDLSNEIQNIINPSFPDNLDNFK